MRAPCSFSRPSAARGPLLSRADSAAHWQYDRNTAADCLETCQVANFYPETVGALLARNALGSCAATLPGPAICTPPPPLLLLLVV